MNIHVSLSMPILKDRTFTIVQMYVLKMCKQHTVHYYCGAMVAERF